MLNRNTGMCIALDTEADQQSDLALGENVTTRGIDLLGLPTGAARLCLGGTAVSAEIARGDGVQQGAQLGGTQRQPGKISVPGPHTPPEIRVH
jgi:hypothetical protein